ncbi:hypothetical protein [Hymenobacter sp. BT190]|uniref:hypothetical protein n=1 Tax=Hymenobacter sp. BT190 TaxID=2763505 RepID=UPI001650DAD7|nr:hypothetical protein [Hymenobacter sp. BT190]MBC6696927.1 hypothetical protein [Hymenobacter sp. BT190]
MITIPTPWQYPPQPADAATWCSIISRLPLGSPITGYVVAQVPFGVFLSVAGMPAGVTVLLEFLEMFFPPLPYPAPMPPLGACLDCFALQHISQHTQIKVSPRQYPDTVYQPTDTYSNSIPTS